VIGLTLGGGVGHSSRLFGTASDNLVRLSAVLADGSYVHASETENPDLFWLARGSGGGFAAITSMTFKLQQVPSPVAQLQIAFPLAVSTLTRFVKFLRENDFDRNLSAVMMFASLPLPTGPVDALLLNMTGLGKSLADLEMISAPLKEGLSPLFVRPVPWDSYFKLQALSMGAATILGGRGTYSKFVFVDNKALTETLLTTALELYNGRPNSESCTIIFGNLGAGGAVTDVPIGKTSYFARTSNAVIAVDSKYALGARSEAQAWVRSVNERVLKGVPQESYVNGQSMDFGIEGDAVLQNRVKQLRARFDPTGVFSDAVAARFKA